MIVHISIRNLTVCVLLWFFRCLPLWVGARGIEFDWKYIQMSFDSNISLVSCCFLLLYVLSSVIDLILLSSVTVSFSLLLSLQR